jgi:hypothetical protein
LTGGGHEGALGDASKFKGHCIVHIKIKTYYYYVYLKIIWYHSGGYFQVIFYGGYFQVIFYDRSRFCAGKKIEENRTRGIRRAENRNVICHRMNP